MYTNLGGALGMLKDAAGLGRRRKRDASNGKLRLYNRSDQSQIKYAYHTT
jgi:hypothetical protein